MPRREEPDPLAEAVGARIRTLRKEAGLTQEALAYESDVGSKGFLSDIEAGYAMPSLTTLSAISERLQCDLLDLVTFTDEGSRHELVDVTRKTSESRLRHLLKSLKS